MNITFKWNWILRDLQKPINALNENELAIISKFIGDIQTPQLRSINIGLLWQNESFYILNFG